MEENSVDELEEVEEIEDLIEMWEHVYVEEFEATHLVRRW